MTESTFVVKAVEENKSESGIACLLALCRSNAAKWDGDMVQSLANVSGIIDRCLFDVQRGT